MRYKICIISPYPPAEGGMSELAYNLSHNFSNDGNLVLALNTSIKKGNLFNYLLLYIQMIIKIFRANVVQIISSSGRSLWAINLPAILMSRIFRKKVILNFVGGSAIDTAKNWNFIKKAPFYLVNVIVVPTKNFGEELKKIGLIRDYRIIPHVVNIDRFLKVHSSRNENIILAVKSLMKYSNYENLIKIYECILQEIPDVKLWIVGDGPEKKSLLNLLKEKKLDNVKLLGNLDNDKIPGIMSQVSMYTHTSKYESFGIAIVEAMAAGLPVVSFSVGGIANVIDDNINGILVPFMEKNIFAKQIIKILKKNSIGERLSINARIKSKQFGWDKIGLAWYDLFKVL